MDLTQFCAGAVFFMRPIGKIVVFFEAALERVDSFFILQVSICRHAPRIAGRSRLQKLRTDVGRFRGMSDLNRTVI